MKITLLGARGFKAFIEGHGGKLIVANVGRGRIFRGKAAAAALKVEGFAVTPHMGPRDPAFTAAQWSRMAARTETFYAEAPIGTLTTA